MSNEQEDIVDEAIGWHMRLTEASEHEWRAFITWLEAAPEHAVAFDRIVTDDLLVPMAAGKRRATSPYIPAVAIATEPASNRHRRFGGWAVAASGALAVAVVVALAVPFRKPAEDNHYVVATAPGEHRTLTLTDDTRIEVNGGTRITLDRTNTRVATLDVGQAMFHARHNADTPFEVHAGTAILRDLGTVFEVTRDADRLDIQVAQGAVIFQPGREAITLKPGMSLKSRGDGHIVLGRSAIATMGGWRSGRLTFSEAPISEVAQSIERTSGLHLEVAPGLASRSFTGSFRLTGNPNRDVPHVAGLAGLSYIRHKERWTITM